MELTAVDVRAWLIEDLGDGDLTSEAVVPEDVTAEAAIVLKERGVVCGLELARAVFAELDRTIGFETPVAAIARTASSVTPPDASVFARPPASSTASRSCGTGMLSSRRTSARAFSASRTSSSVSHSTSTAAPVARARSTDAAIEPARRRWLSLIRTPSSSPSR